MVGDAIENCVKYIINFNGDKFNNAFAYVSRIAYSAIVRRIKKEKLSSTKHLRFIKGLVDVNELSNVINISSEQDHEHYNGYLDNMKSLIDDLDDVDEIPKPVVSTVRKEKTALELEMENGEEL